MWPALIIMAASALLKAQTEKEAQGRRNGFANAMEAFQRSKTREGQAATEELLAKQTPKARTDEMTQLTADRQQSLRDTVGAAQAFDAPQIAGNLSGDYRAAAERNATTIAERTRRAIEQLSAMGAPGEQEQRFGLRLGKASGVVDASNLASEAVGRGYVTDINNVRADPTKSMIANVGMTVGSGMLGGAGAAAGGLSGESAALASNIGGASGTGLTAGEAAALARQQAMKKAFEAYNNNSNSIFGTK
jgi:hypothetical protein